MLFIYCFKTGPNHTTVYVSISIGVLVGLALVVGLLKYFLLRRRDMSLPPGLYLTWLEISLKLRSLIPVYMVRDVFCPGKFKWTSNC